MVVTFIHPTHPADKMRFVLLSDTHNLQARVSVPDGDVLIHAGDISMMGHLSDVAAFDAWLAELPHRHKIVVAGNHDFCFERQPAEAEALIKHALYLRDTGVTIGGVRIYGSPWQPWFFDWAFNLRRGAEIRAKWDLIPDGTDVLITHGPPAGHGDLTMRGDRAGCADLLDALRRVRPRLHVFGHIHEGYGQTQEGDTLCANASICDVDYHPQNAPMIFDWPS